jgi:hypothetical protein
MVRTREVRFGGREVTLIYTKRIGGIPRARVKERRTKSAL